MAGAREGRNGGKGRQERRRADGTGRNPRTSSARHQPSTGREYLESLRDGREVYIYGERVEDVTTHPAFRNAARTHRAALRRAARSKNEKDTLTCPTDTGAGTFTHRFFRVARSREEVIGQRDAIAQWARLSYGWMGRSPDYKASLMNALGANARVLRAALPKMRKHWYARSQNHVLFMNHAIVNPPVDRMKTADQVKDVFITIQKETDAGIIVSGAKVVATSAAITHYNFMGQNPTAMPLNDTDLSVMFITPLNAPGVKIICRASYEMTAVHVQMAPQAYRMRRGRSADAGRVDRRDEHDGGRCR